MYTDDAKKRMRGDATCWSHESRDLQSATATVSPANIDDIVVCTTASLAFLHATGCAYTRAPASTHVADADVRTRATRPRRTHVDAPFACSKDIQSVGRVGRIERKRR